MNYDNQGILKDIILQNGSQINYQIKDGKITSYQDENNNKGQVEYDQIKNIIQITDQNNDKIQISYTKDGKIQSITDKAGNKETYEYEKIGNLISQIDKKGNKTKITYDELGQITKVEGEQNTNISYQYDETGNITKITIKENEQQNIYDEAGRLIQNIQTIGKIKRQTTYSYTSDNLIEQITNAKGQNTKIYYDKLRRTRHNKI